MRDPTHLHWVRTPQQHRSQDTLDRILDAAERLLDQRPFEAISIADVTAEAKSSVGSFYARFRDKDSLLLFLQERLYAESYATADQVLVPEAWQGVPLEGIISSALAFAVRTYREREGVRRAILGRIATDPAFRERARALSRYTCEKLVGLLESRRGEVPGVDVARAVDVCHRLIYSVLDQNLIYAEGTPASLELTDDDLAEELTVACTAYLGLEAKRKAAAPAKKPARRAPARSKKKRPSR